MGVKLGIDKQSTFIGRANQPCQLLAWGFEIIPCNIDSTTSFTSFDSTTERQKVLTSICTPQYVGIEG